MHSAHQQLQSIQAMLAAGHRSVHLDRHSLILIGVVGGFIAGLTEYIITNERFPDTTQRAIALLIWLSVWLFAMSLTDHVLTKRARAQRDETLPFAQAQITRAWWMLLVMGILGSFAMFFYGGGGMIYALWIVLLGLGIYLFGLFSELLIEWIGLATIILGVAGLAAGLPYGATHWLAASCFFIGMPLAGWLNSRFGSLALSGRLFALLAWLTLVTAPALLITTFSSATPPTGAISNLSSPDIYMGEKTLRLDANTPITLRLDLESPIITAPTKDGSAMTLAEPLEIALHDGIPDGRYRIANGDWHAIKDGLLDLSIDRLTPAIEDGEPIIRVHAKFGVDFFERTAK